MPRKRADIIADTLEERVFTGDYADGERLDEVTLAREFGVSRTPIREALQRLVAAHLAEQLPRRGVFVRQPGPKLLEEMFEAMAEFEAACGRLAARRLSEDSLAALEAANAGCMEAIEADDAQAYSAANETFHCLIYTTSGNAFLAGEAERLYRRLKPFRRVQLRLRGRMSQSMAEHSEIITRLRDGDEAGVAEALRRHVGPQGERFYPQVAQLAAAE
jgi:DNA-binding GntR family transcriptional regulator